MINLTFYSYYRSYLDKRFHKFQLILTYFIDVINFCDVFFAINTVVMLLSE